MGAAIIADITGRTIGIGAMGTNVTTDPIAMDIGGIIAPTAIMEGAIIGDTDMIATKRL